MQKDLSSAAFISTTAAGQIWTVDGSYGLSAPDQASPPTCPVFACTCVNQDSHVNACLEGWPALILTSHGSGLVSWLAGLSLANTGWCCPFLGSLYMRDAPLPLLPAMLSSESKGADMLKIQVPACEPCGPFCRS